jgi:hypothetical protein
MYEKRALLPSTICAVRPSGVVRGVEQQAHVSAWEEMCEDAPGDAVEDLSICGFRRAGTPSRSGGPDRATRNGSSRPRHSRKAVSGGGAGVENLYYGLHFEIMIA